MFGLSFSELFIIGIVALIVLGPERLPKVARTIGHLTGRAQRYMSDIKNEYSARNGYRRAQ
ncbi:Sec-independent protein translocase protein TatB [Pelistega indica]|uniref:Sec-independent protein translocase protein TatB n=1 Tax=Pelistega indica TaxID=1414851 RepID=UPI00040BDEE0|nr:Sec-independent protein translocase protein TatB [Pelistega indica]